MKTALTTSEKPPESKFDPFRPEMPHIPGVGRGAKRSRGGLGGVDAQTLLQFGGIAATLLVIAISVFWWAKSKSHGATDSTPSKAVEIADSTPPVAPFPVSMPAVHDGPTEAASVDELSKTWSSKKFVFIKPITQEKIDAMVIRLPGGGLWAFAAQGPYGRCELEFVTDLGKLASQYGFRATHPMVVNPCDSTVYDPLKVGAAGGNTWVRGEIAQGNGFRPPISIEVKVSGHTINAIQIE